MKRIIFIIYFAFFCIFTFAQACDSTVTLFFAGDVMGHSPQFKAAYNSKSGIYDYTDCFVNVKQHIKSADFAVANLETALAGCPYSGYPAFSSPDALLDALKNAGYNAILLANNHIADRDGNGIRRTVETLQSRKMAFAGAYLDSLQRDSLQPLIFEKNALRIAFLNYTYGTNGRTVFPPYKVNYIDTAKILTDIKKAKTMADFTVVCVHWGTEYHLKSSENQQKLAQWLVSNGVNLIVGSHPHVVQEVEFIRTETDSVPVFYSLGNYISNQREVNTNGGIMAKVVIGAKSRKIISTQILPVYVHKGVLNGKYQFHLIPTPDFIRKPSLFPIPAKDSAVLMEFDRLTRERISNVKILQNTDEKIKVKNFYFPQKFQISTKFPANFAQ